MGSTANYSSDHQESSEVIYNQVLHLSDGLLPQYFDGYRVLDRLGGGAMATVYRAFAIESNQEVALKVLAPGADDILRERFRVEARTVSVLQHPNIVQTLQVGEVASGFPYIAMELVEGDSLASLLERQNQLSVADCCLLLEPIARALAYAHSHHVVHRDVKPSNILLRHAQAGAPHSIQLTGFATPLIPLLSDFGIARALDAPELTTAGRTIGTPAYMSPEQCAGTRNLDGRADIYSLATVLYRCLVGRPPFMGATTQILHAHVYEALTIPDPIAQALPPTILNILQRALQKNPEDRYADMALFANDLAALLRYTRVPHNGVEESTVTLPLLAALQPDQEKKTAHVLVSGVAEYNTRSQPADGRSETTPLAGEAAIRNPLTAARTQSAAAAMNKPKLATAASVRRRSPNWLYIGVGALFSMALVVLVVISILSILPNFGISTPGNGDNQAAVLPQIFTPEVTAQQAVTASVVMTPNGVSPGVLMLDFQSATATAEATTERPLASVNGAVAGDAVRALRLTATVTGTLDPSTLAERTPLTTEIAYDLATIWKEDVLFFYRDREWRETRRRVLEVFAEALQQEANVTVREVILMPPGKQADLIAKKLLKNQDASFWERWEAIVRPDEVEQVLFDTYVGIANQENKAKRPVEALAYFDAALLVRDSAESIAKLSAATARYANAPGNSSKELAAQALSELYQAYATQFADERNFCPAAEYVAVAIAMREDDLLAEKLQSYQQQCNNLPPTAEPELFPVAQQGATFIYSTEESGIYRIYRTMNGGENPTLTLLVENGSQPGISTDGRYMAFYSRRSDSQGISLFDFAAPLSPQATFARLSNYIEDALKSAPSWAPEGNRLAFASNREGDRLMRIYVTVAPERSEGLKLDFGEDPAWGPRVDGQWLITYKGTDSQGNNPGLWLINDSGTKLRPLTTNGSDRRPVWSPDGQYVVFMRDQGEGNWELFRVSVADGSELRLTNHSAQDGLPTISPDGRWIAFATDRNGVWEIWQVAIDGGSEQPIMPIHGVLRNWLEHTIQWVK